MTFPWPWQPCKTYGTYSVLIYVTFLHLIHASYTDWSQTSTMAIPILPCHYTNVYSVYCGLDKIIKPCDYDLIIWYTSTLYCWYVCCSTTTCFCSCYAAAPSGNRCWLATHQHCTVDMVVAVQQHVSVVAMQQHCVATMATLCSDRGMLHINTILLIWLLLHNNMVL